VKLNNPRPNYSDLKIANLEAVRHLGFQGRWISTIAWPPETPTEPTYQISAKSDDIWLRYFRVYDDDDVQ